MTYCFLDIETTGLDPKKDEILEIAWSFTDDSFTPLDEGKSYLIEPVWGDVRNRLNENVFVEKMHTDSGLLAALANDDNELYSLDAVWFDLRDSLATHSVNGLIHLAGRSVHFDKSFLMEQGFDSLFEEGVDPVSFHHRMFDISAVKLFFDSVGTNSKDFDVTDQTPHRALADVQGDIGWAVNASNFMKSLQEAAVSW